MARNSHGDFIWYELLTPDVDAAERFYAAVIGWAAQPAEGGADRGYRLWLADGTAIGGLFAPEGCGTGGMPPAWLGYIGVDDVDATVAAVLAAGGRQLLSAQDIPGVGRFALLADPQGVAFYVMRGLPDQVSTAFDPSAIGHCNWNELAVPEPEAALAFWGKSFHWQRGQSMPMGEAGDYTFIDHAGRTIGAVLKTMNGRPPSFLYYFGVAGIDAATAAITAGGGAVQYGPAPIPGGMFITVATDPQGAWFGLVGPGEVQAPA